MAGGSTTTSGAAATMKRHDLKATSSHRPMSRVAQGSHLSQQIFNAVVLKRLPWAVLSGALAACHSSSSSSAGEAYSSVSSSSGAEAPSSSSFKGMNGVATVDGHRLATINGRLQLDGVDYGPIDKDSLCTLLVQNARVRVLIDGIERKS